LGSAATYPLADALGSVRNLATPTASVPSSTSYDVFGAVRSQSGQQSIFGFTGQQTDSTGLSFLRARYYDPSLGRFISPDSEQPNAPGTLGFNLYSYAVANPTSATDPSGSELAWNGLLQRAVTAGGELGLRGLGIAERAYLSGLLRYLLVRSAVAGAGAGLVACVLACDLLPLNPNPFNPGQVTSAPGQSAAGSAAAPVDAAGQAAAEASTVQTIAGTMTLAQAAAEAMRRWKNSTEIALDSSVLIEALGAYRAAVITALAGRKPVVSPTAAAESTVKAGPQALAGFLEQTNGRLGPLALPPIVAALQALAIAKGRRCSETDCQIAASALQELLPIMTDDDGFYKFLQSIPYPVERWAPSQSGVI
jgi:RHS repeat-associated protein